MIKTVIRPITLQFKQPAGTSRGIYLTRKSWLVYVFSGEHIGVGECAPLPKLSIDDVPNYEEMLQNACTTLESTGKIDRKQLERFPSILFGLECAMLMLGNKADDVVYDNSFTRGETGIPINGLVWMGYHDEMLERLEQKLQQGFRCVKLKVGAIDWEEELSLVKHIRQRFSAEQIELRLDANGGFSTANAMKRLESLAPYDIHSIEQPIMAGQWHEMATLCRHSPIAIALDEELIGACNPIAREQLLRMIKPKYIVLKPSLHGGIQGTLNWIELAREHSIGSWITSALESNVGLNAIAQLAAYAYGPDITMPQGLGTGQLYTNNIPSNLHIKGDCLWKSPNF